MVAIKWIFPNTEVIRSGKECLERRIHDGKTNSMGELSYQSEGHGEEAEETDLDGLL